jgi:carbonic anhydrase
VKADLPALQFQYSAAEPAWVNNGHTVQLNLPEGSSLKVGERVFNLLQFHMHTPSEEAVGGKRFDMVAHFVHRDAQGQLGVVGVLFKRGKANPAWESVLAHLPRAGETITVANFKLDLPALLPTDLSYYAFDGSLTTPPCSEGVSWMVLKTPLTLSGAQLAAFRKLFAMNARPLQPGNGRVIQESK